MKEPLHFTTRFNRIWMAMLFMAFFVHGAIIAQTSKEYADADVATFVTDLIAGTYDVYILSTSGGVYDIDYPSIPKTTTIKAKEGLADKPILKNSAATATAIVRANGSSVRDTLIFENLEFDGTGTGSPLIIRSDDETHLVFTGCYIHDATDSNGAIRMNNAGSTLDVQNTIFANSTKRIIHPYTTGAVYGDINIQNCTFSGITGGDVVYFRSAGGVYSAGNNVTIDHCTFYNIEGNITRYQTDSIHGVVSVTNSIFEMVNDDELKADVVDYNFLAGFAAPPTGTNSITTAPQFADAANLNFTLLNKDELTGGDFQILGDLSWYEDTSPPRVFDALVKVDQTHVMVSYNELVDETTAVAPVNYALSGTAGHTGNPTEVVLEASGKDVTLTVADMSGIQIGETVVVTVSNVTDILGNLIADNNVATYTLMDETPPVVTMTAQAVTNDPGQVAASQSNETGMIYLVHADVAQTSVEDFEAANNSRLGSVAEVATADIDVSISTAMLKVGDYYAYAVDNHDNISDKSANVVTVSDVTPPEVTMEAQEVPNSSLGIVLTQSNEPGMIYLVLEGEAQTTVADFEAAIAAGNGSSATAPAADAEVSLSAEGLQEGSYYSYAVDDAGNISSKSSNAVSVTKFVPRVRYYESTETAALASDLIGAIDGDIFILTSSGGLYQHSAWVNITSKVTIMADEDLAERPILTTLKESNTTQVLRFAGDGASITVKGIEFNSGSREPGSWPIKYAIRTNANIGNYSLVAENCVFRGVWQANDGNSGAIVKLYDGTFADSIIFRNCIFEGDEAIVLNSSAGPFDWDKFEISNCTFMNIPDDQAILIAQHGENKHLPLNIDHCTFYGVGGLDQEVIRTDSLYTVTLTNSIFASTPADTSWHLWGAGTDQSLVDYTNFFECVQPMVDQGGVLGTNIWTDDPLFADPVNGDLTLGNQAMYTLGSDGLPLGDLRWADIFGPKVQPEMTALSDSTLLLKFDEWVDTTSAEVVTNYELSGSAGLTGAVKKAELVNFHAVLLTMDAFTDKAQMEITVTVSNVLDLKGNLVDPLHNSATYVVEEFMPVITADAQSATNGTGELVIVQSNQGAGSVYIILDGEAQATLAELDAAVAAKKGAKTTVTVAYTDIEIAVSGIEPGTYYAYATDAAGNLSEKGANAISVTDGIPPVVSNAVQSVGNGEGGYIVAQSNEPGKIYIVMDGAKQETENDFISAVYANKGSYESGIAADTDVQLSTSELIPGIYFAYAVDEAGNISEKGSSPLNITDATGIDNGFESQPKVFSFEMKVVVETTGTRAGSIVISDMLGRKVVYTQLYGNRSEFLMDREGIYFISIWMDKQLVSTTKLIVQ